MVRHILADGREVKSIEGFVVPATGATEPVYRLLAEFTKRKQRENSKKLEITQGMEIKA